MERETLILTGISVAFAFAVTMVLMPYLLKRLKNARVGGIDVNKR